MLTAALARTKISFSPQPGVAYLPMRWVSPRFETLGGKIVAVTGASSGIGREIALQLAERGAHLSLAARSQSRLEETARLCRARDARALVVPTDVAEDTHCRRFIESTIGEYGRLDILINNAGISMIAPFAQIRDLKPYERLMRVNYLACVYCCYYALPFLLETRGRIAAICSASGRIALPARTAYSASKHAMTGFLDALRVDLAGSGVTVTVLYPDFVDTELREKALGNDGMPGSTARSAESTSMMTAAECARLTLAAVERRRRELVMSKRARLALWARLFAPSLLDFVARKAVTPKGTET